MVTARYLKVYYAVAIGRAAAQRTRDLFKQAGQTARLTYWEEESLDHFMKDANGVSHEEDVMARIADWIRAH